MVSTAVSLRDFATTMPTKRTCGMSIHLRNKKDQSTRMVAGVLCGMWNCTVCGPYLK